MATEALRPISLAFGFQRSWFAALLCLCLFVAEVASCAGGPEGLRAFLLGPNSPEASLQFADEVLRQEGKGLPGSWGVYQRQPIPAWYSMSPGATNAALLNALAQALRSLPSVCIDTEPENLFSREHGVYLHPDGRGRAWERRIRLEFVDPMTRDRFRANCGLRIHGGMSRRPEESPKHSLRLVFDARYGASRLRFPLFAGAGPGEFTGLVLRAGGNDSWLNSQGRERARAVYLRDEWMRRTMLAMSHRAARGRFVHLYLNDLYWGVFNLCELPGPGTAEPGTGYDFIKDDNVESGDRAAFDRLMALGDSDLAEERHYREIAALLDLEEFADYVILNIYAGNMDWSRDANWYAIRPRRDGGRFRFLVWDAEQTLGDPDATPLAADEEGSPLHLFHRLSLNPAFQALVAARMQRLFSEHGPLAPGNCSRRLAGLAAPLERALLAEAARWGSYRQAVHRFKSGPYEDYAVATHWHPEIQRIQHRYFLERKNFVFAEFERRGLLPTGR